MHDRIAEKICAGALNQEPLLSCVATCASKLGVDTYLIGGYLRDILLNRPSKDMDFVSTSAGPELAQQVARSLGKKAKLSLHKNFGTAQVVFGSHVLEFVSARKESYRRDSRKPSVVPGTLEEDQKRRDFTINALSLSLNKGSYGKVKDPFGGLNDLENRLIKTPLSPEQTFSDDPLRILRAIRFASQLDFRIESHTWQGLKEKAARLSIVSQERITSELNKIILSPVPSVGFQLLFESGILKQIFPEMNNLYGVDVVHGQSHKENFYHTLKVLDNVAMVSQSLWLRWAAILHDIAKPLTKRYDPKHGWTFHGHEEKGARMVPMLFRRFGLSSEKAKYVARLVRFHLRPIALAQEGVSDSALRRLLFELGKDIEDLMILCRADITSKDPRRVQRYTQNFDMVEEKLRQVEERDRLRLFQPPISGEHIMKTFGIKPGKVVGKIKDAIREAIIEGQIGNSFEEAETFMFRIATTYLDNPSKNPSPRTASSKRKSQTLPSTPHPSSAQKGE